MRLALVVACQPVGGHPAHLIKPFKDVAVEDLLSINAIEVNKSRRATIKLQLRTRRDVPRYRARFTSV
jgi:hypothetical protein